MSFPDCGPCMNGNCHRCLGLCGCVEEGCITRKCKHNVTNQRNLKWWQNHLSRLYGININKYF